MLLAAEEAKRRQKEEEEARKRQKEAEEEEKRRKEAEEVKLRLERISLLRTQQKYNPGDRVIIIGNNSKAGSSAAVGTILPVPDNTVTATVTMTGSLGIGEDVGEVQEYKIEDLEAFYVVRVVTGREKDQVLTYSPDSLLAYSETMCQKLGLDDFMFQKYDRIVMTIRKQKLKVLESERIAAIAARQMAKAKEINSQMKSIYVHDKIDTIPDSEMEKCLASLLQDLEARYMKLALEENDNEAALCDSTKNELMPYYIKIRDSSISNMAESAELFTFLKDTCSLGYSKAKHYSALMYSKYDIESIKTLKLLYKNGVLRNTLSEFISSGDDITHIEEAIHRMLPISANNRSRNNDSNIISIQNVSPSAHAPSAITYYADGKPILDVRPLSESLDWESVDHISYNGIYTGYYVPPTGRVDVVIKVGDGRRDLAAEERMLRYLRDSCREAVALGVIRLIDYSSASVPAYLVLERYGEDIRAFFKSPTAVEHFKKFGLYLLQAVDSIHKVGIMHGDLKPHNILFRDKVGHYGFKLCDFENACKIGEMMSVGKYTKAWVSPEVYLASEEGRVIKASAAVDVFSLGLILGALFDGNCYINKTILPNENADDFHRTLTDQEYLYSLLPCQNSQTYKTWIHNMCKLDPTQRCTVSSIIRNIEANTTTNLVNQNKFLRENIETKLDLIDNKLTVILERVTLGFESLKINLTDLIQSSFENILNNSNDENNILQKLLTATEDFSQRLKSSSSSSNNTNCVTSSDGIKLSEAKEGLKTMEVAIREAIESHMTRFEADRRQEMSELQTTILNRCQDLEAVLKAQSADSKDAQATLNAIAQRTALLHQDLVEVRQELANMKQSLFQLAEATRSVVASNERLRLSVDRLEAGLHRMEESDLEKYQKLNKKLKAIQTLMEVDEENESNLQESLDKTNSLLLTILKGAYDIPTLVILLPEISPGVTAFLRRPSRLFFNNYRLFFVCSYTLCIAPCGPKGQGYPLSVPKEWVKKAAPVLKVGLVAVKLALATSGISFPISDLLKGLNIPAQAAYFDTALQNLQSISDSTVTVVESQLAALTKEDCLSFLDHNAEGTRSAYEGIKEMLKNFPNFVSNCGLVFVEHKGKVAWVLRGQEENWRLALRAP